MGTTFAEVRRMARRANQEENQRTMFFSSRVSIYLTYLLARTKATANGVTCVFSAVGVMAAALVYLPAAWAPLAGFAAYRLHVVLDVVDGELARYRRTCSPLGAYLDYLTHYFVYTSTAFGFGVHHFLVSGSVGSVFLGFAVAVGLMMNLASRDCWYRANYGSGEGVEGKRKLWNGGWLTLLAVRTASINTLWFLFSAAALAPGVHIIGQMDLMMLLLVGYGAGLPLFALARIVVTARAREIPRRASWYR